MKILNILPYSPVPPHFGGALRIFHLLHYMVKHHDVSVIAYGDQASGEAIRRAYPGGLREIVMVPPPPRLYGKMRRWGQFSAILRGRSATSMAFYSPGMQKAIDRFLVRERFDIIQMENYPLGFYNLGDQGALHVMDAQNVEYDSAHRIANASPSSLRRWFYEREAMSIRREETAIYRKQSGVLLTSDRDRSLLEADLPEVPKFVVPNGVDLSYFQPGGGRIEPASLVFTGSMNYYPNTDGVLYFLSEIFPLIRKVVPNVRFYAVGISPPKSLLRLRSDSIVVTGAVDDVRPFVERSAVYVVPLRMGGGTRLKVLEAMAMQKPVVTTTVGCEGVQVRHNESVLIANDPSSFAASVAELLNNRTLAARLQANGYEIVRSHYTWEVVGDRLGDAYRSLTTGRPDAVDSERGAHRGGMTTKDRT
jgi:glycosyltransferase involved in cell wall biosynthesis